MLLLPNARGYALHLASGGPRPPPCRSMDLFSRPGGHPDRPRCPLRPHGLPLSPVSVNGRGVLAMRLLRVHLGDVACSCCSRVVGLPAVASASWMRPARAGDSAQCPEDTSESAWR